MFSDFKKAFKNVPNYSENIPQVIIDAISADLPEDLFYVHDHDGFCQMASDEGLKIQPSSVCVLESELPDLPKEISGEDLKKYIYNAQKTVKINPDGEGNIVINGHKIKIDDMIKAPLKDIKIRNAELWIEPHTFPSPFTLIIGNEEYKREMFIQRVANDSFYTEEYKSINEDVLSIRYTINTEHLLPRLFFSISFNIEHAKSAKDIVSAYEIYNSFIDGKGLIAGNVLSISDTGSNEKISSDTINFWSKVDDLEQLLGCSFIYTKDLTIKDLEKVEALHCSLIEEKPFKTIRTYKSVKGKGDIDSIPQLEENQEIYLEFGLKDDFQLLGQNIPLYELKGIFGATINYSSIHYIAELKEYEVELSTVKNKIMYCSSQYFLTKEELEKVRNDPKHIETFSDAKELDL